MHLKLHYTDELFFFFISLYGHNFMHFTFNGCLVSIGHVHVTKITEKVCSSDDCIPHESLSYRQPNVVLLQVWQAPALLHLAVEQCGGYLDSLTENVLGSGQFTGMKQTSFVKLQLTLTWCEIVQQTWSGVFGVCPRLPHKSITEMIIFRSGAGLAVILRKGAHLSTISTSCFTWVFNLCLCFLHFVSF